MYLAPFFVRDCFYDSRTIDLCNVLCFLDISKFLNRRQWISCANPRSFKRQEMDLVMGVINLFFNVFVLF